MTDDRMNKLIAEAYDCAIRDVVMKMDPRDVIDMVNMINNARDEIDRLSQALDLFNPAPPS